MYTQWQVDIYSAGVLLLEMCHPFDTQMCVNGHRARWVPLCRPTRPCAWWMLIRKARARLPIWQGAFRRAHELAAPPAAAEHAASAHGMSEVPPEVVSAIRDGITDVPAER